MRTPFTETIWRKSLLRNRQPILPFFLAGIGLFGGIWVGVEFYKAHQPDCCEVKWSRLEHSANMSGVIGLVSRNSPIPGKIEVTISLVDSKGETVRSVQTLANKGRRVGGYDVVGFAFWDSAEHFEGVESVTASARPL